VCRPLAADPNPDAVELLPLECRFS